MAVEEFSALALVAQQSGQNAGAVADAFKMLGKNVGEATQGNKTAVDDFNRLGVAFADAQGNALPLTDVMMSVADAIAALPESAA